MDQGLLNQISQEAIYVMISISWPILLIALFVGLAISLLQALTQIQENTLTFVPKILIIYLSMLVIMPYMLNKLSIFMDHIIQYISGV
jgi:flagellar biosynthetic protein FliQ